MYDGFFSEFGLPKQLHSDLGKNFESKLLHELCLLAGVNKSHTTPFHPQSDEQTERMNRTLLQMLRTTADENPGTWPQRLATLMAAYRMIVHKTTGLTPNKHGNAGTGSHDSSGINCSSARGTVYYFGAVRQKSTRYSTRRSSSCSRCDHVVCEDAKIVLRQACARCDIRCRPTCLVVLAEATGSAAFS